MNRYALLIEASNVCGEQELPGARNDVKLMQNYLMEPIGGCWLESEIEILNKPSYATICVKLALHATDYCMVYFSGHGSERKKGCPTVCLNDTEREVPVMGLYPESPYGVVIADCCRGSGTEGLGDEDNHRSILKEASTFSSDCSGRRLFDLALGQCIKQNGKDGIIEMLACAYNESASETKYPHAHGVYTFALLAEARRWYKDPASTYYLTTSCLHSGIREYMASQGQHPCYTPESLSYPFAIKE